MTLGEQNSAIENMRNNTGTAPIIHSFAISIRLCQSCIDLG